MLQPPTLAKPVQKMWYGFSDVDMWDIHIVVFPSAKDYKHQSRKEKCKGYKLMITLPASIDSSPSLGHDTFR